MVKVEVIGRLNKRRKINMAVVAMSYLLEAGVHFGHQTKRWNPKMKEYIYSTRDDIYIMDLQKTVEKLEEAYDAFTSLLDDKKQGIDARYSRSMIDISRLKTHLDDTIDDLKYFIEKNTKYL